MRKIWLLLGVALLGAMLSLAVACSDDDDDGDGDAPTATEPAGEEPTEAASESPAAEGVALNISETDLGAVLADADGMTLYVFDNDEPGVSNCGEGCTGTWPPLVVTGEVDANEGIGGTVATIERDDGTMQVTYNDQPLYYYSGDSNPGDTNGEGVGGIWHVVVIE